MGIFHTQTQYSIIWFIALEITTHRIKPIMNIKNPWMIADEVIDALNQNSVLITASKNSVVYYNGI